MPLIDGYQIEEGVSVSVLTLVMWLGVLSCAFSFNMHRLRRVNGTGGRPRLRGLLAIPTKQLWKANNCLKVNNNAVLSWQMGWFGMRGG